jgi:predicted transcriptional regulator
LFRYNYEELNEPETLNVNMSVKLSSEVFDVESRSLVWAIESNISRKEIVDQLVDDAVKTIIKRLQKDGLID